jgi:hypothetical protein
MKRILQAHEEMFQFQEMKRMQAHEEIKRILQMFQKIERILHAQEEMFQKIERILHAQEEMFQKIERILQTHGEMFQEMKRILQTHGEMIQGNMFAIRTASTDIQQVGSRVANLETEYSQLTNSFVQSSMNANSEASNHNSGQGDLVEEATVQHLFEAMEISEEEPVLHDQGPDDATSHNIF